MNKSELRTELATESPGFLASKWVLERTPFVFGSDTSSFIRWKEDLSQALNIDARCMIVTGSASCGFSLSPVKNFKNFTAVSDVDVAVISVGHFDSAWRALRNLGTKRYDLSPSQKADVEDHINRLIFYGTIATDKILPLLPFAIEWARALTNASSDKKVAGRVVNARIYRDFESLREYQIMGLKKLKQINSK